MDLPDYSTKDLKEKLDRREITQNRPELLAIPDIDRIRNAVIEYIDFMETEYHEDNEYTDFIFEVAVTAFYGRGIWHWIRKIMGRYE